MVSMYERNTFFEFKLVEPSNEEHPRIPLRCMSDPKFDRSFANYKLRRNYYIDQHGGRFSNNYTGKHGLAMHDDDCLVVTPQCAQEGQTGCFNLDDVNRHGLAHHGTMCGKMDRCSRNRPDKKRRQRFSRFVQEQKARLSAQPHYFDIEAIELPSYLQRKGGCESSLDQLKRTLYQYKQSLTIVPATGKQKCSRRAKQVCEQVSIMME